MTSGHAIADGKMLLFPRQTAVSAEFDAIAVQDHSVFAGWRCDPKIAVRAGGVKIKNKHKVGAFTCDNLVFRVLV